MEGSNDVVRDDPNALRPWPVVADEIAGNGALAGADVDRRFSGRNPERNRRFNAGRALPQEPDDFVGYPGWLRAVGHDGDVSRVVMLLTGLLHGGEASQRVVASEQGALDAFAFGDLLCNEAFKALLGPG